VTYSLVTNAGGQTALTTGAFQINATTGVVTVRDGSLLNYEAGASATVHVKASSADGSSAVQSFTVSLTDRDEFDVTVPVDANTAANSVQEGSAVGTLVGVTASASDADGTTNAVTYSLVTNAGGQTALTTGAFQINATTGVVTVRDGSLLNYEAGASATVHVKASSADGSSAVQSFTVSLTDTTAPTVSTFSPTDGATGVAVASNIVVTFSETIARGTGNIELRSGSATGTIVETFNAASSNRLTLSNNQLTIDPTSNLSNSTQYFVVMASGTIKDGAGNNYTGTSTYDFTTIAAGPTAGNDTLVGTASNETINGLGGNDVMSGLAGNDTLIGGLGNDTLDGGAGNDVLTGGDGIDTASYASATAAVTVSLALGTAQNTGGAGTDTLATIENLTGSAFNDILTGSAAANRIEGGAGNDVITGGAGIDTLDGGEGNDIYMVTLLAHKAAAEITDTGATGTDELRFAATAAGTLTLLARDTGLERVVIGTGTTATAVATATTALNVNATSAANALTIVGNAGINTLTGSAFNDTLDGGAGNDSLVGGSGNDSLIGGAGKDTLTGGIGSDTFVFKLAAESAIAAATSDVITDFVRGQDKIDLSAIDAFAGSANVNDIFIWRGTAAFNSTTQGEVRYEKFDAAGTTNDHTMVWIDNDNDTVVEMAIRLTGLFDLTDSDFIL
jgi:Ca2+-binding RTX toxin-like protein